MSNVEGTAPKAFRVALPTRPAAAVTSAVAVAGALAKGPTLAGDKSALSASAGAALRRFDGGKAVQAPKAAAPKDRGFAKALVASAAAKARIVREAAAAELDRLRRNPKRTGHAPPSGRA